MSSDPGPEQHKFTILGSTIDVIVGCTLYLVVPVWLHSVIGTAGTLELDQWAVPFLMTAMLLTLYAVHRGESFRLEVCPTLARYFGFMVVWVPIFMILYPYVVRLVGSDLSPQEALQYFARRPEGGSLWLSVAMVCIAAPLAEEVLFRGFLFRLVSSLASPAAALVLTSVLFGLVHEPSVRIPVTFLGLLFGYLRLRSGGVGASILAHMVHNSLTVAAFFAWPELLEMVYEK